jgi:hypothetical protein
MLNEVKHPNGVPFGIHLAETFVSEDIVIVRWFRFLISFGMTVVVRLCL